MVGRAGDIRDRSAENLETLKRARIVFEPQVVSHLTIRELLNLKAGSTVVLDHALGNPVLSSANGKIKFTGRIVSENGERAFLIEDVLPADPPQCVS